MIPNLKVLIARCCPCWPCSTSKRNSNGVSMWYIWYMHITAQSPMPRDIPHIFFMFGREAKLPLDVCFGTCPNGKGDHTHSSYVTKLKENLQKAYTMAIEVSNKRHQQNKRAYDKRLCFHTLGPGVLLKNLGLKGKHKLENHWCSLCGG